MKSVLQSSGWAISSVQEDYGIDYLVEIFHANESTGVFFKVQLKSSGKTSYSAQNDFISQPIKIQSANYLCREVRTPVILVHADVSQKAVFWMAPQLDLETIERLRAQSDKGTITLRIPSSNSLPETIIQLAEAVNQVETVLACRTIVSVPIPDFLSDVEGHIDADEYIREVQDKSDALRIQQATKLFQAGKFEEVEEIVNKVLKNKKLLSKASFGAC